MRALWNVYDDYAEALQQLVDAKTGASLSTLPAPAPAEATVDLMRVLEESVRAAQDAHGKR